MIFIVAQSLSKQSLSSTVPSYITSPIKFTCQAMWNVLQEVKTSCNIKKKKYFSSWVSLSFYYYLHRACFYQPVFVPLCHFFRFLISPNLFSSFLFHHSFSNFSSHVIYVPLFRHTLIFNLHSALTFFFSRFPKYHEDPINPFRPSDAIWNHVQKID